MEDVGLITGPLTRIWTRTTNPMATLYYAENVHIAWTGTWIPTVSLSESGNVIKFSKDYQWRIPGFPWVWGTNSQSGRVNPLFCNFFAENCMKMKEFGFRGERIPGAPLLGSANDYDLLSGTYARGLPLNVSTWEPITAFLLWTV